MSSGPLTSGLAFAADLESSEHALKNNRAIRTAERHENNLPEIRAGAATGFAGTRVAVFMTSFLL
jgi:hypothetical protein